MVRSPRVATSHGLECRESDAASLETKITGRHIDFMISTGAGSGLLNDFSIVGYFSTLSLEEAYWLWRRIFIPWHGKTFAACKEEHSTVFFFLRANSEEIWKYFHSIAFQVSELWKYAGMFLCIGILCFCSRSKLLCIFGNVSIVLYSYKDVYILIRKV